MQHLEDSGTPCPIYRTHGSYRLNTVEFIQHYSSCNMVRPYCLETSNVAIIPVLDSVRSENNKEWTVPQRVVIIIT